MFDNIKGEQLYVEVNKHIRKSFESELKKKSPERVSFAQNLDVFKRVKESYGGKKGIPLDLIKTSSFLYPLLPWETRESNAIYTDEDLSNLYVYEILVGVHVGLLTSLSHNQWFKKVDVENQDNEFIEVTQKYIAPHLLNFQLFFSQNIIEMEKHIDRVIRGMDSKEASEKNMSLINILSEEQFLSYTKTAHTKIHTSIQYLREVEISRDYERTQKIETYKRITRLLSEYLKLGTFFAEAGKIWMQHKYFYEK